MNGITTGDGTTPEGYKKINRSQFIYISCRNRTKMTSAAFTLFMYNFINVNNHIFESEIVREAIFRVQQDILMDFHCSYISCISVPGICYTCGTDMHARTRTHTQIQKV